MNPHELLNQAASIINARGEGYGGIENNFQLAADMASLRLGRDFHPYEVAIMMVCVKNARAFASPSHLDSHIDAVNYELFAATFAEDYLQSKAGTAAEIGYKRKKDLKPARRAELSIVDDQLGDLAIRGEPA
jgi:hypothetical protein